MPLYEYQCAACGHRFEKIQKFSDDPIKKCPKCGKNKVERLISSPAIQFKGTGWYITDYARKGSPSPEGKADGKEPAKEPAKPDAASTKEGAGASSSTKTNKTD